MTDRNVSIPALLTRLVAFESVSRNSNIDLIEFIADYLEGFGCTPLVQKNSDGGKANVFVTIGPADRGQGLMLAGHSDVVPVDGQVWRTEPFRAVRRDGRIFGRGTCDMKGFIAVALSLVPQIAHGYLSRPLHLAFTYDEEVGCFGAAALARMIETMEHKPSLCIVGEPTNMRVVNGHKGKLSFDCRVLGLEGHSAHNDRAVNAIEIASELIVRLRSIQKRLREQRSPDCGFDPPFTTIHTGTINGGIARNIVPRECRFQVEIRNLPEEDPKALFLELQSFARDELLDEMRAVYPKADIDFNVQSIIPALTPGRVTADLQVILSLAGANRGSVVSFATEAGLYQRAGVPTIVCGPGDIAQAHRPDEFIAAEQLERCSHFLREIVASRRD